MKLIFYIVTKKVSRDGTSIFSALGYLCNVCPPFKHPYKFCQGNYTKIHYTVDNLIFRYAMVIKPEVVHSYLSTLLVELRKHRLYSLQKSKTLTQKKGVG